MRVPRYQLDAPPQTGNEAVDQWLYRLWQNYQQLHDFVRTDLMPKVRDVDNIQGVEISSTPPSDNQVLTYDAATETWGPETP